MLAGIGGLYVRVLYLQGSVAYMTFYVCRDRWLTRRVMFAGIDGVHDVLCLQGSVAYMMCYVCRYQWLT